MSKTAKWAYFLAPVGYPAIGFFACLMTLFLAAGMRELGGNAALTLGFGARGLFQITAIAGVVVALVAWFFQELRKTLLVLFALLALGSAILGWVFAQSIIHF